MFQKLYVARQKVHLELDDMSPKQYHTSLRPCKTRRTIKNPRISERYNKETKEERSQTQNDRKSKQSHNRTIH